MKVINFLLAVIAIVIAVAAFGMSMRGGFTRFADMQTWKITEAHDAVVLNSIGHPREVTVCNRQFRRSSEGHDVVVATGNDDAVVEHMLAPRSCITTRGESITIAKPAGESFETYGIYKLSGSKHMRSMGHSRHGKKGKHDRRHRKDDSAAVIDESAAEESPEEMADDRAVDDEAAPTAEETE